MYLRIRALACLASLFLFCFTLVGRAQDFPTKPVHLVVPSAAGGSSDTIARIIAQNLSASMGQTFVVENRPGAGGNIGAELVAQSKPDGYTLLFAFGAFSINPSLYAKLNFDPIKDFDPVILICTVTGILVVNPAVPAKNVQELIRLARAEPGKINFASAGNGTVVHLAGEMFKSMANVDIVHVPYKGSGPALADLIGGQVQLMFANMPGTLQHVQAGRLRVLAVTSDKRSPLLPDVPTIGESGVPGYRAATWFGVLAPAGTPARIIARLNAEFAKAIRAPELAEHLKSEGAEVVGGSPEEFRQFLKTEIEEWGKVVRASGAKVN
jgi:tripartite-type tricarboxylate transporter receptor subunit TctC